MACIYKIRNLVNDNFYIGSTIRPKYKRKYEHFSALRANLHCNSYLQKSWNKYGEENFVFEVVEKLHFLEDLSKIEIGKKLIEREAYFIQTLHPEYNLNKKITLNGRIGYNCSEETKRKISESNLKRRENKPLSKSALERIDREIRRKEGRLYCTNKSKEKNGQKRISTKGWKHTPQAIQKITERSKQNDNRVRIRKIQKIAATKRIGTHHSFDSKLSIVKSKFGRIREIMIYDKMGNLINICNLSTEAALLTGVKRATISNNLCGLSKSAGNYIFKYKE